MLRTFTLAALAALNAPAMPARANGSGSDARFDELDRNGDGFVSRDEYAARRASAAGGPK